MEVLLRRSKFLPETSGFRPETLGFRPETSCFLPEASCFWKVSCFLAKIIRFANIFLCPTEPSGDRNFGISNPYEVSNEVSVERKLEKFSKFRSKMNYCVLGIARLRIQNGTHLRLVWFGFLGFRICDGYYQGYLAKHALFAYFVTYILHGKSATLLNDNGDVVTWLKSETFFAIHTLPCNFQRIWVDKTKIQKIGHAEVEKTT
jgi:hypothetical protein